jgi:hypothetical protein
MVEPPQGIQYFHEADLGLPSKHEYFCSEEYFLCRNFQIQDLSLHKSPRKQNHMLIGLKLDQLLR